MKKILVFILVLVLLVTCCKPKDEEKDQEFTQESVDKQDVEEKTAFENQQLDDSQKETEEEDTGFSLKMLDEKRVWTFTENGDYEWSVPVPYFNPMGEESEYSDIRYEENSYAPIYYMSRDRELIERYFYGEVYELTIDFKEDLSDHENAQFLSDIKPYIESLGGTVQGIEQDQTVFMTVDSEGDRWWGSVHHDFSYITIDLIKERELKAGESMVIRPGEDENYFHFATYQDGTHYQRLAVETDGGYASLYIESRNKYGAYSLESHVGGYMDEEVGTKYLMGNLPLTPGVNQYEVTWDESTAPGEITISLEEDIEMPAPAYGEEMGAIKVSAAYVASVDVTPTNADSIYIDHPESSGEEGRVDRTPDGDFMIFVPSGYWDVHMSPSGDPVISEYSTIGVPVSAGEMTEVKVPYPMAASMSNQNTGYDARGVEIGKISEDTHAGEVSFYFTMLDNKTKEIPPSLSNTSIYESGQNVQIKSIEHVDEPPKIILLLDSSGSMKGQLEGVKKSAEAFVKGLPEDSQVKVIDFDTSVKVLDGTSVSDAVNNIKRLSVGGDTALYASLQQATALVDSNERGTIVLFTDGENDLSGNEVLTKEDAVESITANGVPVYAIGYGEGHDGKTLNDFAKATQGLYFDAQDTTALDQVFTSIHERLGSTYMATYERPTRSGFGDVPVITFMVDTSGSMGYVDEGAGERMNNVKNLLPPFMTGLPDDTLVQLIGFLDQPYVIQSLTANKRKMLQGVAAMEAGGSTDVSAAVLGGWFSLKHVPSSKKVMVFITDEAMDPDDDLFIESVDNLKKDGIEVLWVGLGLDEVRDAFARAAEMSESDYVVTSDVDELTDAFNKVLAKVKSLPPNDVSQISIEIEKENELGAREEYGDSTIAQLSPMKEDDTKQAIELIKEEYYGKINQYDPEIAVKLTGISETVKETLITGKVTADKEQEGDAARIKVEDVIYMSKLYGVEAPSGYRFLGLETSFTNILKEQEVVVYPDGSNHPSAFVAGGGQGVTIEMVPDYLIPDFRSHLFVTINDTGSYPASDATWLTNKPLVNPGDPEIFLQPKVEKEGMLVFVVPEDPITQLSLHLYDTAQGGTHVPIIGEMKLAEEELTTMPESAGEKLSDTFSAQIMDVRDAATIIEEDDGSFDTFFRQVDSLLTSNVHALLELEPTERIHLTVPTGDGEYWMDIHEVTSLVPYGHYQKRQLAPGSNNRLVWAFELPEAFKGKASDVHFELAGGDIELTATDGDIVSMNNEVLYEGEGEGFKFRIHDAFLTGEDSGYVGQGALVLDVTVEDVEDGYSTQGISELIYWEGTMDGSDEVLEANLSWLNEEIICSFKYDTIVYDGTSRRGYIVFDRTSYEESVAWTLKSSYFDGLELPAGSGNVPSDLIHEYRYFYTDETFAAALREGVYEKTELYRKSSEYAASGNVQKPSAQDLNSGTDIPVPMMTVYGRSAAEEVKTVGDIKAILKSLRYIPMFSYDQLFHYDYSMEATLSQGFATENEYLNVALTLLRGIGLKATETKVEINDRARAALSDLSGVEVEREELPAVTFYEGDEEFTWVMPFVEDLRDLSGYCYYSREQGYTNRSEQATVSIAFEVEPLNPDRTAQMGMMGDALAGETDAGPPIYLEEVYYRYIDESELSQDAVDIGFATAGNVLQTYMLRMNGVDWAEETINLSDFDVKAVQVQVSIGSKTYKHRTALDSGRGMEHIFMTLGINLPDLTEEAAAELIASKTSIYSEAEDPSDMSALRWYGRNLIGQFVHAQSVHEKELAETLEVTIGRTEDKRVMVVSMKAPMTDEDGVQHGFEASVDLVDCFNDIHAGVDEAKHSFNILSGLFMTNMEAAVLGDGGYGAVEIMAQVTEDTDMVVMDRNLRSEDVEQLLEAGLPEHIITYMQGLDRMILMPNKPAVIDGVERWAWFEVDPNTYETIGVIDTFERGAMVSNVIIDTVKNSGQYMIGGFVGINTSVWAVSAISLEETDYEKILEEAKKYALGMKDAFGLKAGPFSKGVGGKPSFNINFGLFKWSFDGKGGFKQNVVGFTQGYEAGVNYYFEMAQ